MRYPNLTPADVESLISSEHYFTAAHGCVGNLSEEPSEDTLDRLDLLTFCVLVTHEGHTISGEAHCQNPQKFDAEIGKQEARKDAIRKLWPMAVFATRDKL